MYTEKFRNPEEDSKKIKKTVTEINNAFDELSYTRHGQVRNQ